MIYHFTEGKRTEIVEGFENGAILIKLARKFGCSKTPIRKILTEELGLENYKQIAKEHLSERSRKMGQLAATEKQKEACRKLGQAPKTEKQLEHSRKWQEAGLEASVKAKRSKQEILFSVLLANENIQFSHQFKIYYDDNGKKRRWFVDFFIFPNIIVQSDGVYWHCQKEKGALLEDWRQNRELKKQGFKVIRFWDFEIYNDVEKCLKLVKKVMKNDLH